MAPQIVIPIGLDNDLPPIRGNTFTWKIINWTLRKNVEIWSKLL